MMTRWMISLLGMYACGLMFMYRAGISVAVVYMTQKPSNQTNESIITEYFEWNQKKQGTILSASFYLYWCFPTLIGCLTDRYGGQWFAFAGVLGPCLLSALAPFAIEYYQDWALIVIQILMGAFHGFIYPALFSLYSKWFSCKIERSRVNSYMQVGNAIGCSAMYLFAGHLCTMTSIKWHLIFYAMAIMHVPWILLWLWFGANDPRSSKRISDIELDYIERLQNIQSAISKKKAPTPWPQILTSMVVWSSAICKMCCAFGFFLLLNKMPSYFAIVFNLDIRQNGLISAMVIAAFGLTSFLGPFLVNIFVHHFGMLPLQTKKISQNLAMAGPAFCLLLIPQIGPKHPILVFLLMIASMFFHGFYTSGEWNIVSDYAKNFSGSIVGFVHSLAFLMGILAPMVVGFIFELPYTGETSMDKWNMIFYITAATYLIGDVIFLIFATDQQQEWDKI